MINMVADFSITDFIGIKQLLNSTDDDVTIAIENIKNLGLDPILILLLAKVSPKNVRDKILEEHSDIFTLDKFESYNKSISKQWGGNIDFKDLSWENLHETIKTYHEDNENLKNIFTSQFENELNSIVMSVSNYKFMDDIKYKITW